MSDAQLTQTLMDLLQSVGATKTAAAPLRLSDPTEIIEDVGPVEAPEPSSKVPSTRTLPPRKLTAATLFRSPDAHPITLDLFLMQRYGVDWLSWDADALEVILKDDLRQDTTISDVNLAKINACKTLHLVDTFWTQWEIFNWCTAAFNGVLPHFQVMQVPTFAQCLVAVDVANRIRADVTYSAEVQGFLYAVLRHDGMLLPQAPIDIPYEPIEDVDLAVLQQRWQQVLSTGQVPTEDTLEAEQLRRMQVARTFLEESRTRLRQQLEVIHA